MVLQKEPFCRSVVYHSAMAKMATAVELMLTGPEPGTALFQWLYEELRSAILDGRLPRGTRLPATREIAQRYKVSRGTVVTAFEQLESEGYLRGRVGAGTFVNTSLPEDLLEAKRASAAILSTKPPARALSRFAQHLPQAPAPRSQPARAFRSGEPALDAFPLELWAQITSRRVRHATRSLLSDVDARGYRPLREALADYLGAARGVRCTADQVIIVSGAQQGLDLTARIVLDRGDPVWMEDPGYFGATYVFKTLGARVIPVPVDRDGLNVTEGRRRCKRAKLAYVTPSHQFPLGTSMTLERRLALLDWARAARSFIFEDDYNSEYRYSGRPLPALQGLAPNGSVIFAGTFSKVLFPGLRLGYLVVPDAMVDRYAAAKFLQDRHCSVIEQAVVCDFIAEGHFSRHIRRMRELYAHRLALLLESAKKKLGGVLRVDEAEAGMQTIGWLRDGLSAEAVAKAALARNIELMPISRLVLEASPGEGVVMGFAAVSDREIARGIDELAQVIDSCRKEQKRVQAAG